MFGWLGLVQDMIQYRITYPLICLIDYEIYHLSYYIFNQTCDKISGQIYYLFFFFLVLNMIYIKYDNPKLKYEIYIIS